MRSSPQRLWLLSGASISTALVLLFYKLSSVENAQPSLWHLAESHFKTGDHPISDLIRRADTQVNHWTLERDYTIDIAAKRYRQRRGRHPPPGFDKWVRYAQSHDALINEEFFDQIYEDLEPFWGLQPSDIRKRVQSWNNCITIRSGAVEYRTGPDDAHEDWVKLWTPVLETIAADLPDLDMPINNYDEPRVIVPWEDMNEYMRASSLTKHTRVPTADSPVEDRFTRCPPIPKDRLFPTLLPGDGRDGAYWKLVRAACPPDSEARSTETASREEIQQGPRWDEIIVGDYVQNFTESRMPCNNPHLRNLHGNLVDPDRSQTVTELIPIFSASKISGVHNDILLPPAVYYDNATKFTGGEFDDLHKPWEEKEAKVIWRGRPTGDHREAFSWRSAQRQRLVAMTNETLVELEQELRSNEPLDSSVARDTQLQASIAGNFPLPDPAQYPLSAMKGARSTLAKWIGSISDTGFFYLLQLKHLDTFFSKVPSIATPDTFNYKYLPDIDGYAYSGRYRSFLLSSSVPLKATIHSEWHDSRLVPWHHFVPLDNTLKDWWGVMEYFIGYNSTEVEGTFNEVTDKPGHDEVGKKIALQGQQWAEQVLRREDMTLYIFRLLLEYGRLGADERMDLGWVQDLR